MSDLMSKKALVKAILAERDKHPLEVEERYSFGVKVPCKFNQALRGGIRKCLHLIEIAPTVDAVEVVRCEKCKHSYETILGSGCEPLCGLVCTKGVCVDCIVPEDFYCPYGERKEVAE